MYLPHPQCNILCHAAAFFMTQNHFSYYEISAGLFDFLYHDFRAFGFLHWILRECGDARGHAATQQLGNGMGKPPKPRRRATASSRWPRFEMAARSSQTSSASTRLLQLIIGQ